MKVTNINIYKTTSDVILANGSVTFDEVFFVKFKIMKSSKDSSLFVSWPSQKGKDGEWYQDAGYFINNEEEDTSIKFAFKNEVDNQIIKECNTLLGISSGEKKKDKTPDKDAEEPKEKPKTTIKFGPTKK